MQGTMERQTSFDSTLSVCLGSVYSLKKEMVKEFANTFSQHDGRKHQQSISMAGTNPQYRKEI